MNKIILLCLLAIIAIEQGSSVPVTPPLWFLGGDDEGIHKPNLWNRQLNYYGMLPRVDIGKYLNLYYGYNPIVVDKRHPLLTYPIEPIGDDIKPHLFYPFYLPHLGNLTHLKEYIHKIAPIQKHVEGAHDGQMHHDKVKLIGYPFGLRFPVDTTILEIVDEPTTTGIPVHGTGVETVTPVIPIHGGGVETVTVGKHETGVKVGLENVKGVGAVTVKKHR